MTHPYIPLTEAEQDQMLERIGVDSVEDLFEQVPEEFRLDEGLDLPEGKSELEVDSYLSKLAKMNDSVDDMPCFLGGGAYDHYIPSIIDPIVSRAEFLTSYTPYQPELSQGTLQYIFEYQSLIARLTGMDVANASLYDGGTAVAEAAIMACNVARSKEILVSKTINPRSMEILKTYAHFQEIEIIEIESKDGATDIDDLKSKISETSAGFIMQSPNYFGIIEDVAKFSDLVADYKKTSMVLSTDPFSLGVLRRPGDMGVDVVIGEGQGLGIPLAYGGPYLGIMAAKEKYMRKLPGRLVGETLDRNGKRSYVLTLSSREQHIRRDRATSNICSNQGLNTLRAAIYMSVMGKEGMKEVASQACEKAHYAFEKITATGKFKPVFEDQPFFMEFALKSDLTGEQVSQGLYQAGILGGISLEKDFPQYENAFLLAVTEKRTKEEIDELAQVLEGLD